MTIYPLVGPHYLNLLNQLMAIQSSRGFSPARGISHCFTNTRDRTYSTKRVEEKKNKQAQTWVSSKRKKGEVFDTFLWAIANMYPSEIPTQPPETLAHPLALADLASEFTGPSSLLSSCLSLTVTFPWLLLTALRPCLSLSSSALLGNITCKPFELVLRQTDKGILWQALTHTHRNECTYIVPQLCCNNMPSLLYHSSRTSWLYHNNMMLFLYQNMKLS